MLNMQHGMAQSIPSLTHASMENRCQIVHDGGDDGDGDGEQGNWIKFHLSFL